MAKNVGNIERVVRIVVGIAIVGWGYSAQNWWGIIGLVPLLTGLVGWCPPYAIFGINTCSTTKEK